MYLLNLERRRSKNNTKRLNTKQRWWEGPMRSILWVALCSGPKRSTFTRGSIFHWMPNYHRHTRSKIRPRTNGPGAPRALKEMNRGKCLGSDGLTVEFCTRFWPFIEAPLRHSIRESTDSGIISQEQRWGIITLISKKHLDQSNISNWRPITLLKTDYKLLTKAYSIRLQSCICTVIHMDQTGFLSGRYIAKSLYRSISKLFVHRDSRTYNLRPHSPGTAGGFSPATSLKHLTQCDGNS